MADVPPPPPTHTQFFAPPHPPLDTRGVQKSTIIAKHACSDFVDKHYDVIRQVGQGAFGSVTLVEEKVFKQKRVCKRVSTRGMNPDMLELLKWEVALLRRLDHPHVVKIYEYAIDEDHESLVLILEHLGAGDAFDYVVSSCGGEVQEPAAVNLIRQVLFGLRYCHAKGIVHRDIKLENLVLASSLADSSSAPICKIIDFGLATHPDSEVRGLYGTPSFMAPEVAVFLIEKRLINVKDYTSKADLWSVGVCALMMVCGWNPFDADGDNLRTFRRVLQYESFEKLKTDMRTRVELPDLSLEAWLFLSSLLEKNSDVRLAADGALEHAWLQLHDGGGRKSDMTAMALNLSAYQCAPPMARCCLYLIAARLDVPELQRFGATFLELDANGDGTLSREELAVGLRSTEEFADADVDIDIIMKAADLSHKGGINFTEFVAACLYQSYASIGSLGELMQRAFIALDTDRDGLVSLDDVLPLFRERDARSFQWLPQDRPFDAFEWLSCLKIAGQSPDTTSQLLALEVPVVPPQLLESQEGNTVAREPGGYHDKLTVIEEADVSENADATPKIDAPLAMADNVAPMPAADDIQEESGMTENESPGSTLEPSNPALGVGTAETVECLGSSSEIDPRATGPDSDQQKSQYMGARPNSDAVEQGVGMKQNEPHDAFVPQDPEAKEEPPHNYAVKQKAEAKNELPRNDTIQQSACSKEGQSYSNPQERKYAYEVLVSSTRPDDVDPVCKEAYLSDEEFLIVFGITMADFKKMQKWKQQNAKKAKKLF